MPSFEQLLRDIPEGRIRVAQDILVNGVSHPAFDMLAELVQVELPRPQAGIKERLAALTDMSFASFDLRGLQKGVERQNLDYGNFNWEQMKLADIEEPGSPTWNTVTEAADMLHMIKTTAPRYDDAAHARVMPGAFGFGPLQRLQFVLGRRITPAPPEDSLPENGNVLPMSAPNPEAPPAFAAQEGLVVALGVHRPLNMSRSEHRLAAWYAPEATDEFGLVVGAVEHEIRGRRVRKRQYELPVVDYQTKVAGDPALMVVHEIDDGNLVIKSLCAPTPAVVEQSGRAQTHHTYSVMRTALKNDLLPRARIVKGTHARYVPFQGIAAHKELGLFGEWLPEVVGFSTEAAGSPLHAASLLPEFHSHIRHLGFFAAALDAIVAAKQ